MSAHDHSAEHALSSSHGDGHDFAHPMPVPTLLAVFAVLVGLTIITVAQASFSGLFGDFDVAVVMIIATIKAVLVGYFFMHLSHDKPFNIVVFISAFVFVGLFIIFTLSDSQLTTQDMIQVQDSVPTSAVAEPAQS